MNTHCPECGKKYDKPQPDDYICRSCGLGRMLWLLMVHNWSIVVASIKQKDKKERE